MKIITKTAAQYHPRAAVVSLTDDCNLRCIYCFNHFKRRASTFGIVKRTCEYLLEGLESKADRPILTFFGGEPLLKFKEIIKPIVVEYYGRIRFNITTNGVLLTEEVVDFFADHEIPVLLSIDGAPKTQNRQRPCAGGGDSAVLVEKNIPYLLLRMPDTVFRATLTPQSVPELYDNFKYAQRLGFREAIFIPNSEDDWSGLESKALQKQFEKIGIEACEYFSRGEEPPIRLGNFQKAMDFLRHAVEGYGQDMTEIKRCGLCTTSMGVDVDGNIHGCQENNSNLSDEPLGDIFSGIDETKLSPFLLKYQKGAAKLRDSLLKKFSASTTPSFFALSLTASLCPKKLYQDDKFEVPEGWIYYMKSLYNAALPLYKLYRWSANPFAIKYLGIREEK